MKFILLFIFCIVINLLTKYLWKLIEDYKKAKKVKEEINKVDFNKILSQIDKDFYNDITEDDIDNEK